MTPIIRVDSVSKNYRISSGQAGDYRTLRESLSDAFTAPFRRLLRGRAPQPTREDTHWALRDISFEVHPGEVVGLIGRNGAGKSTLLKVLSRITEPTSGRAELRGRVISLLEVGTGFHQELTGRENIYLNGSILGMSRREIDRKFDAIVAFAEIDKFLDTPSKRYSSGMYIRLAFAVAAHLDAEILILDEVLAVGDAAFQKKCLERIRSLATAGGTVLFVSHNMGTVASLCQSALVLDRGKVLGRGPALEQVRLYMNHLNEKTTVDVAAREDRSGTGLARITRVQLLDGQGRPVESAMGGEPLTIRLHYRAKQALSSVEVLLWVCNDNGLNVTFLSNRFTGEVFPLEAGDGAIDCVIPEVALMPGGYTLNLSLLSGLDVIDGLQGLTRMDVEPGPFFATGRTPSSENALVLTRHTWRAAEGGQRGDAQGIITNPQSTRHTWRAAEGGQP